MNKPAKLCMEFDKGQAILDFFAECTRAFGRETWNDLASLVEKRDRLAAETRKLNFQDVPEIHELRESCAMPMRGLPLYRVPSSLPGLADDLAKAWKEGPLGPLWDWALTWLPCFDTPWNLAREWALDGVPDEQLADVLSFLLASPVGWSRAGESDAMAEFLEKLLPEIRGEAARAAPPRQKEIDDLVLAHLDIGFSCFGEKNLRALTLARGELLQDVLQRLEPDLSLHDCHSEKRSAGRKTRLGVVVRYFKPFIDNWVLGGFLTALPREKFEITLYSVQDIERRIDQNDSGQKAFRDRFMTLIDRYESLDALSLRATVEKIRADRNDIILLANAMHNGTAKGHLLQAYRLAPLEIVTTNTPSTCGFKSVDYYMTSKITEPPDAAAHYTETVAWLPNHSYAMEFDPAPEAARLFEARAEDALWLEKQGIPRDAPVAVSGSGWPKLTPETLAVWTDILKAVPEAHLILDPFSPSWRGSWFALAQENYLADLLAARGVAPERCHILQLFSAGKTMAVMARASLYLDAFPYSGNMALREPLLMGCPVVTRIALHQRGMQGSAMLKSIGLDDLVAAGNDDYKNIAIGFLRDKPAQEKIRARIKSAMAHAPIYDSKSLSRDFAALLGTMVADEKST